jgi:hypothetical protein
MSDFLSKASAALYSEVVARSWSDEGFRNDLLANPKKVLLDNGFDFLQDFQVKIAIDADKANFIPGPGKGTIEFPLPNKPDDLDAKALRSILSKWPHHYTLLAC